MRLGGLVDGDGALAVKLRSELELLPYGRASDVSMGPEPAGSVRLDPQNPYHVDAWCKQWLRFVDGVELEHAPKLAPLPVAASEPDRVY